MLTLIIICLFTSFFCEEKLASQIHDIIPTVYLKAGVSDTMDIRDLFYTNRYDIAFNSHPSIRIKYETKTRRLIITPDSTAEGLSIIEFDFLGHQYAFPIRTQVLRKYTFTYVPSKKPSQINLFGLFNSWNRENLPMHDADGDGRYDIVISLEPGRYEYKFFIDGDEVTDPNNPIKVSNPFGDFNSVLTVPSRHPEKNFLHKLNYQENTNEINFTFLYEYRNQLKELTLGDVIALIDNAKLSPEFIQIHSNQIRIIIPKKLIDKNRQLRVAVNQNGVATRFQTIFFNKLPQKRSAGETFLWHDAIIYSIMIDRFFDGDPQNSRPVRHSEVHCKANFYGGDLPGIIQKLQEGYFDNLGVNVLWLSPVNLNTPNAFREFPKPHRYFTGYHGYWPVHHQKVDDRFGDLALFKKLVNIAHRRGMKVILDFVANHVHEEHVFFQEHPEWFGELELPDGRQNLRMWDEYRLTTWFDKFLPSFDYVGSTEAREMMTDNAVWWMKETKIDGFRQDAVKHIPNEFWRLLTYKIKKEIEIKEQRSTYQIGETFGSYDLISSYVNNGQLTAQFNFNLYDVALYVFLTPQASFKILDDEINKSFDVYGINHLMGNLMDSHDKVRYMAYADGDLTLNSDNAVEVGWQNPPKVDNPNSYKKAKIYLAYMLAIPGIPVIYYGDEIGMTGAADPDNRRPMRFNSQLNSHEKEMLSSIKEIIKFRREHTALRYGDFLSLVVNKKIYAFMRSDMNERILVVINKNIHPEILSLNLPKLYKVKRAVDLRSNQMVVVEDNKIQLHIDGEDYKYLLLEN